MPKSARYSNALHIAVPVPEGTPSGAPVRVGQICGVTQTIRQADGTATVWLDRSWELPVDGAVAAFGAQVYIKADGTLSGSATNNKAWGTSLGVKGAGVGLLEVVPLGYTTAA